MKTNRLIQISANAVALTLFAAAIGCGRGQNPQAQLALLAGALPISLVGSYHGHLADKADPYQRMRDEASLELYAGQLARAIEVPVMPLPAPMLPAPMLPAPMGEGMGEAIAYYDWQQLPDDASGVIITGNAGSGKSSLALWLLGLLTQQQPAIIKVLDPHATINNWHEHGLETVADFEAIENELAGAVAELDRRRKLTRSELKSQPPYIFVADELMGMISEFENPKSVSKALSRLGCEGRKYGVSLIAIAHTSNADALGIDAKLRSNYLVLAVGAPARQIGEKVWGKKSPEFCHLHDSAYPCLVSGSVADQVAIHPTHGYATQYKKQGVPPRNLLPINQVNQPGQTISNQPKSETDIIKNYLDRLYNLPGYNPPNDTLSQGENESEKFSLQAESENEGENAETQTEREFSPCSESENQGEMTPEPGNLGGLSESENIFTLDEAGQVLASKKSGKNKPEIIATVWGVKPGKSRKYESAKAKFEAIQAYWESLNLWV